MAPQPFLWSRNGRRLTPEQVAQERDIAAALMEAGSDTSPVAHWLQGAARLGQAFAGNIRQSRADRAAQAGQAGLAQRLQAAGALPGFTPSASPVAAALSGGSAPASAAASAPQTVDISGSKQQFIDTLMPAAIEASARTGVDPRIIVAQAAQETGWGRSAPGNNFFGIKSHGQGGGQTFTTHEVIDGKRVKIQDSFRQFASPQDSVAGYADFITQNKRYTPFREAQGLDNQLAALQASGYATDPNYSQSVGAIARSIPWSGQPVQTASLDPSSGVASALVGPPSAAAPVAAPVQVAQAQPAPYQGSAPPMPQTGFSQRSQALMGLLNDPWLDPGSKAQIQAQLQQEQAAQDEANKRAYDIWDRNDTRGYEASVRQEGYGREDRRNSVMDARDARDFNAGRADRQQDVDFRERGLVPGSVREYEYYADQERKAGREPLPYNQWDLQGKKAGATQNTVNLPGQNKFDEEFAKGDANALASISESGMSARRNVDRINQLEKLLSESPSGWQAALAQRAGEWGVNTKGLDTLQAAQAMINSLVPEQRQPGSGPMSDADLELFKQSLPRIINQPGGNKIIIDTMRAIAQYDAEGASIVQRVRLPESNPNRLTRDQAFEALQSRRNPLADLKLPGADEADPMRGGMSTPADGTKRTKSGIQWSIN